MTGFGRAAFTAGGQGFSVEIKSLNHRYLDIKTKIPEPLSIVETRVRSLVKERLSRGSVLVTMLCDDRGSTERLNIEAASGYCEAARALKAALKLDGDVDLALIMRQKGVLGEKAPAIDEKKLLAAVKDGLARALDNLEGWRIKEGATLTKDLKKRTRAIKSALSKVEKAMPKVRLAFKKRLAARIQGLSPNALSEPSVLVETAVFAEKTDITEEIVRLKSHLGAFADYLAVDDNEPIGKKLDFLAQEIFRELNTIASKAQDAFISQTIVTMKWELEKIREQALNIE